jgi:poly(3-hydroxybutyrate) depolymerase
MLSFTYQMLELNYLALAPARLGADLARRWLELPHNPLTYTSMGRNLHASAEVFERLTRRYEKPVFGLDLTIVNGKTVPVVEQIIWQHPFCNLIHFVRDLQGVDCPPQSKLLIVAPMSGHYATLLRGTVEAFLPTHDVYITDWIDARYVPPTLAGFDLDDYIDYFIEICQFLSKTRDGIPLHLLAVCQPSVPVMAGVARMEAESSPHFPASMTLMGGPIDTRCSPTKVNLLAQERGSEYFRKNFINPVPLGYPGSGRKVYPGFLQLAGFMAMNIDRHVSAQFDMFNHLVEGDDDSAEKHREFYDEYLAVMDLTAEYYLQTVDTVFVDHALPKGEMKHRGEIVDPGAIRRTGLLTVEGEKDDISGIGQTKAAHDLCNHIPDEMKADYLQEKVGHYGVFNGSRFRNEIVPRICAFHQKIEKAARTLKIVA